MKGDSAIRLEWIGSGLALLLLVYGAVRFLSSGFLPATEMIRGDFAAAFPTPYFAQFRPDFPTGSVWKGGWQYGPMLHFVTLPLLLVPQWSMVAGAWALVNLAAIILSFTLIVRMAGGFRQMPWQLLVTLLGLWLLFQPLGSAFAQGNIEIVEMALVIAAIAGLRSSRDSVSGVLLGMAAMMKFLPVGFIGWCLLRGRWRAAAAGLATVVLIGIVAGATLGWSGSAVTKPMGWTLTAPIGGLHELSVTSMFLHRAGVLDGGAAYGPVVRWLPTARALTAAEAGGVAGLLFVAVFGVALFVRRKAPISLAEVAVLFMAMFMILPWNHDYYYVFALFPFSVLFVESVVARRWYLLAVTMLAYVLISLPVPFSWIDRLEWSSLSIAYVLNFHDVPAIGGLLLWLAATYQWLSQATAPAHGSAPTFSLRRAMVVASIGAAIIVVVSVISTRPHEQSTKATVDVAIRLAGDRPLAVSHSGDRIAYLSEAEELCERLIADSTSRCWPELRGATDPFFSPDDQWIAFFHQDSLKKVPIAGGAALLIHEASGGRTGSWDHDPSLPAVGRRGTILFAAARGIFRISNGSGEAELIIAAQPGDGQFTSPTLLLSGDTILFAVASVDRGTPGASTIFTQSLVTGRRTKLAVGTQPRYDRATGRLVYSAGGRVFAAQFDPPSLKVADVAVPVVSRVLVTSDGHAQFAMSDEGTVIYAAPDPESILRRRLLWVDRSGRVVPLPISPDAFELPRISPDGRRLAVEIRGALTDVWIYTLNTGERTRLTPRTTSSTTPVWNPDGQSVAVAADGPAVWLTPISAAGGAPARLWSEKSGGTRQPIRLGAWSRDGRLVVGSQGDRTWLMELNVSTGARPPSPSLRVAVSESPLREADPVLSPDGRWIAFASGATDRAGIYVRPSAGLGAPRRVADAKKAAEPVWAWDSRQLFFRNGDDIMAVDVVEASPVGAVRRMFSGSFATAAGRNFDVAPDGDHFVMVENPKQLPRARGIHVLRLWPMALPR